MAEDTTSSKRTPSSSDASADDAAAETESKGKRPRRRPSVTAGQVKAGSDAVRSRIASLIWLVAALCAVVLALAAVLTALGPANEQNAVVQWLTSTADVLAGPFGGADGGVFSFKDSEAKNALANWGLAAAVYLVVGRLLDRVVRP